MKFEWSPSDSRGFFKRILILCAIVAAAVLLYLWRADIGKLFSKIIKVIKPLLYAIVIAYILWPMLRFFETHVFQRLEKEKPKKKLIRTLALILTYLVFLAILTLFFSTVIPQVADSFTTLMSKARGYITDVQGWFNGLSSETPIIGPLMETEIFTELRGKLVEYVTRAIEWLTGNLSTIMSGATDYATNFAKEALNVVLGVIFAVYFLLFKENLFAQVKKLMHSILKDEIYDRVHHYLLVTDQTFGGFISGKLLDSLIIGVLCFVLMSIFRMPYAPLISMIIGVTNVIPFFGPIIGAVPSAFFILIADPKMTLWFILLVFLLQQLDGNVIGPKILGNFVGLTPLWIIVAITVMGGLFGVFGLFFGVPTFAVVYAVVKEIVEKRLAALGKAPETISYYEDAAFEEIVSEKPKEARLPVVLKPVGKKIERLADRVLPRRKKSSGGEKKPKKK